MAAFFVLLTAYIATLLGISWWVSKGESQEDYLIAGRDRPWWQVLFSKYAAAIGAGWIVVYIGMAYEYGITLGIVFVGLTFGSIFYAYWAVPRIYSVARKNRCYTQGDFVYALTGNEFARTLTNILAVAMSVIVMVIAAVGGATLMETYGILPYEFSVFVTIGIVLLYILLSGYKAVMLTDIFQGALIIGLLTVLLIGLVSAHPLASEHIFEVRNSSLLTLVIFGLFGFFALFADPNRYQVGYAAKSESSLKSGMLYVIIPLLYTSAVLYLVSAVVYGINPGLDGAEVFPQAILTFAPAALAPLGLIVFFVAIMSSMDSFMYVIATHLERLIYTTVTKRRTRILITLVSLSVVGIALLFRNIIDLTLFASAILFSLAIPMLYLLKMQEKADRFVGMVLGGIASMAIGILAFGFMPEAGLLVVVGNAIGAAVPPLWVHRAVGVFYGNESGA